MRIGIDIMGGDYAPESTIRGSILAKQESEGELEIVFVGDRESIERFADKEELDISSFPVVHTESSVVMGEHPFKAYVNKPRASVFLGQQLLKSGELDGFCSAGNTGAMLVGAMHIVTAIPGVIRPAISTIIPNLGGPDSLLLDVGLNPDARPDVLYQYGVIGSLYARLVNEKENPTVSLLNLGKEEDKGNLIVKSAYQIMSDSSDFHFIGNMEANDLFVNHISDVIVCDGFVGNVVLKEAEAFYKLISLKGVANGFFEMFNFENFGGTPVLGVKAPLMIGHGISNDRAIRSMILKTREVIDSGLITNIKELLNK